MMKETGKGKIVLPARITKGEVIRVQTIVQHPMDTGFFRNANADIIPAYFIQEVIVEYAGAQVARFEWTSGISRDPMVVFTLKADQEGPLTMTYKDNRGAVYQTSAEIRFAPS
jgi:sulfur-oxidizing protein SoxZ